MYKIPELVIIVSFVIVLSGCFFMPRKSDYIVFKNSNTRPIYVYRVEGFKKEPPVGYLSPQKSKGAMISDNKASKEIRITWFYKDDIPPLTNSIFFDLPTDEKIHESVVVLEKSLTNRSFNFGILFLFDEDARWTVKNISRDSVD